MTAGVDGGASTPINLNARPVATLVGSRSRQELQRFADGGQSRTASGGREALHRAARAAGGTTLESGHAAALEASHSTLTWLGAPVDPPVKPPILGAMEVSDVHQEPEPQSRPEGITRSLAFTEASLEGMGKLEGLAVDQDDEDPFLRLDNDDGTAALDDSLTSPGLMLPDDELSLEPPSEPSGLRTWISMPTQEQLEECVKQDLGLPKELDAESVVLRARERLHMDDPEQDTSMVEQLEQVRAEIEFQAGWSHRTLGYGTVAERPLAREHKGRVRFQALQGVLDKGKCVKGVYIEGTKDRWQLEKGQRGIRVRHGDDDQVVALDRSTAVFFAKDLKSSQRVEENVAVKFIAIDHDDGEEGYREANIRLLREAIFMKVRPCKFHFALPVAFVSYTKCSRHQACEHVNVCKCYEHWSGSRLFTMVLERLEKTMEEVLDSGEELQDSEALLLGQHITRGLQKGKRSFAMPIFRSSTTGLTRLSLCCSAQHGRNYSS